MQAKIFSVSLDMGKLLQAKLGIRGFTLGLNEKLYIVDPDHKTHIPHIHMHVIPRRKGEKVFDRERLHLTEREVEELIKILRS